MRLKDLLLALCVVIIWGVNFVVIKVGLEGIPPFYWQHCASCWSLFPLVCLSGGPQCPLSGYWRMA